MTDAKRLPDPLPVIRRLPKGAGVILRHYDEPARRAPARLALARRVAAVCRERCLILLIAGDWRLARMVKAAGVHWPERVLWRGPHHRNIEPNFLVTASVHSFAAIKRAERCGVDAVLLSPVFSTLSHPSVAPLGAIRFAAMLRRAQPPVIALGGIDKRDCNRIARTGACGVAGIGLFAGA
jgi:thiamine-phosphate pyrophosphorylase